MPKIEHTCSHGRVLLGIASLGLAASRPRTHPQHLVQPYTGWTRAPALRHAPQLCWSNWSSPIGPSDRALAITGARSDDRFEPSVHGHRPKWSVPVDGRLSFSVTSYPGCCMVTIQHPGYDGAQLWRLWQSPEPGSATQ